MAEIAHPGSHKKSPEISRRDFNKTALTIGAVGLGGGVAGVFALLNRGENVPSSPDTGSNSNEISAVESGSSFNGYTQPQEVYDGRLSPADFMKKTEAQRAEVMTLPIEGMEDDMVAATEWVKRWELYTNLASVPAEAQEAIDTGGFVLLENKDEPSVLSIQRNYEEHRRKKYGHTIEYLTDVEYEGENYSPVVASIEGYADDTAHNFGNEIWNEPDTEDANVETTTHITVDSVKEADTPVGGDRKLEIGVTMRFAGPYKDPVFSGFVHLILNEDGERYNSVVTRLKLDEQ